MKDDFTPTVRRPRRAISSATWAVLSIGTVVGAVTLWAPIASSAPTTPLVCPGGELFCFAAGDPALAGEVNHNFAQLKLEIDGLRAETTQLRADVDSNTAGLATKVSLSTAGDALIGFEVVRCIDTGSCSCPPGKKVIAGGGSCSQTNSDMYVSTIGPGGDSWSVQCWDNGFSTPKETIVFCARVN